MNIIPIYRAKKMRSDGYIMGLVSEAMEVESNTIVWIRNKDEVCDIDLSTLAIHFPDWICTDAETDKELEVFASLQKDKKGGSEIEIRDNFQGAEGTLYFNGSSLMFQEMILTKDMLQAFQVTGIQK